MKLMRRWAELPGIFSGMVLALVSTMVSPAIAHEVRPAYLQITARDVDCHYEVLWKQPVMGELAVHLAPQLADGWLEETPTAVEVTDSYSIKRWKIAPRDCRSLEGQPISVEGLENTITDVLLEIRLADGFTWRSILTPASPQLILHLNGRSSTGFPSFLVLGIEHILTGIDHLLFVLGLLLIVKDRWVLLKTVTAFTVAHSITLAVATLGYVRVSVPFLNTTIALSIAFLGSECVRHSRGGTSLTIQRPWAVAFVFGLLHGFGFASGLTAVGLPRHAVPWALLLFNAGVEIGQLAFVLLVVWLEYAFRVLAIRWPRPVQMFPAYTAGTLGAFWTIQRLAIWFGNAA
jgi:hydrogenase/urease accessory protein HupE